LQEPKKIAQQNKKIEKTYKPLCFIYKKLIYKYDDKLAVVYLHLPKNLDKVFTSICASKNVSLQTKLSSYDKS
jgi:hypothetical protein